MLSLLLGLPAVSIALPPLVTTVETIEEFNKDSSRPKRFDGQASAAYFTKLKYERIETERNGKQTVFFFSPGIYPKEQMAKSLQSISAIASGINSDGTLSAEATAVALDPFQRAFNVSQGGNPKVGIGVLSEATVTDGNRSITIPFQTSLSKKAQQDLLDNPAQQTTGNGGTGGVSKDQPALGSPLGFILPRPREFKLSVYSDRYFPPSERFGSLAEAGELLQREYEKYEAERSDILSRLFARLKEIGLGDSLVGLQNSTDLGKQPADVRKKLGEQIVKSRFDLTTDSEADTFRSRAKVLSSNNLLVLQVASSSSKPGDPHWLQFGIPVP